jgi:type VI secretion system protein ImpA
MSALIDKLLENLSADHPCGPDLSNDPRFDELETILKGKPEVDIGNIKKPAEPPDWRELRHKSADFLRQSKHLRAAIFLCCSLLKTEGLPGFRDGLQLIRGLLERYWVPLHPLLDPQDNNDPTYRLNILGALTAARGSVTGWLTIQEYLYTAPLCQPKGAPAITFEQLQLAKQGGSPASGAPADGPGLDGLAATLRNSSDQVVAHSRALSEALEAVKGMDKFLTETLTAGNTISFEPIEKTLQEMASGLAAYLPGASAEPGAVVVAGDPPGTPISAAPVSSGVIRSRGDVVRALDSICDYYRNVEPGSPVPFLLRRAQKLATMDFLQAMKELNLANPDSLRPIMGSLLDGGQPPAA